MFLKMSMKRVSVARGLTEAAKRLRSSGIVVEDRVSLLANSEASDDVLTDTHGRFHDYLRISLTERCNLRCECFLCVL